MSYWLLFTFFLNVRVNCVFYINQYKSSTAVAMKQTLGRQVGEVQEHECNMHVCVGVG